MSEAVEIARRILDATKDGAGRPGRPADYDLRVAETYASIAQAEALERLALVAEAWAESVPKPIRMTVAPEFLGLRNVAVPPDNR